MRTRGVRSTAKSLLKAIYRAPSRGSGVWLNFDVNVEYNPKNKDGALFFYREIDRAAAMMLRSSRL